MLALARLGINGFWSKLKVDLPDKVFDYAGFSSFAGAVKVEKAFIKVWNNYKISKDFYGSILCFE